MLLLSRDKFLNNIFKPVKYPRTYHLPWSPGVTREDRIMSSVDSFKGQDVVVTVKMDGENTTLYHNYIHARSVEYSPHESRDRIKAMHAQRSYDIPPGWRVCGENLYAKHSIHYEHLPDYFLIFSIWDEVNKCLSWSETKVWVALLEFKTVPVLYEGVWDENLIRDIYKSEYLGDVCEGYVVRLADSFHYKQFKQCVGKYVRKNHVHTHGHWMRNKVVPNLLEQ